jgi:dimethylargininase
MIRFLDTKDILDLTMRSIISFKISRMRHGISSCKVRKYTLAITRQVSPQISDALVMKRDENSGDNSSSSTTTTLSYSVAHEQHQNYVKTLRSILPTMELPYLDGHPDSVFVEDCLVAVGTTVVVTQPGHASRRGEVSSLRTVVEQFGLDISVMSGDAYLDGGDVLYTGRHLYVGRSSRTNDAGIQHLQHQAFSTLRIIPVDIPSSTLHLKSLVTHLDAETLLAPLSDCATQVLSNMLLESGGYETIRLPHPRACNVVRVRNHVLAQPVDCDQSKQQLMDACQKRNLELHWVDTSELAKVDGALTCCSVLLDC